MDENSQQHRELSSTLNFIGKHNDGKGPTISFGDTGKEGVLGQATGGDAILLDEKRIAGAASGREQGNPQFSKSEVADITLAEVVVHEGRHARDNTHWFGGQHPKTRSEVEMLERNAYRTQQSYLQAEGLTSGLNPLGASDSVLRLAVERGVSASVRGWCGGMAALGRAGGAGC